MTRQASSSMSMRTPMRGNGIPYWSCSFSNQAAPTPYSDRKSTRLNSSHLVISYAVFCLKKKLAEAFQGRGLATPQACLMTFSVHLRTQLVAAGPYVSAFPTSFVHLNAGWLSLTALPIDL